MFSTRDVHDNLCPMNTNASYLNERYLQVWVVKIIAETLWNYPRTKCYLLQVILYVQCIWSL